MLQDYYKAVAGLRLPVRIYPPAVQTGNADTVVLCIHGGGWAAVEKNEEWDGGWMDYQARYYAQKGFTGAVISYRSIYLTPETSVFDQIQDCYDGLSYIAEKTEYKRLILIGDSAGGHLAAMMALGQPELADIAVLCNPVTDCTDPKWAYIAGPDRLAAASPLYQARKTKTKYLIVHGDADTVVPWETSQAFYEKMRAAGNQCIFRLLPGVGHAFILKGYASTDQQIQTYMELLDHYIEQNL